MSFPCYPKYKPSGVEWLGQVPEQWEVKQVKNLASIVNGYPFDSTLFNAVEGSPLVRIRDLNKSETETYYRGEFVEAAAITADDVLIGMDGDFNIGRWRGKGTALLNQRMCCVRGKSSILTRLLEYSLPIPLKAINEVTYATTVKHLASSQVEKTFVALPPKVTDQTHIVDFLDRETAKIYSLVAEQQRLIELLNEKREAITSHAVTKGLNPDAPMKPSGIEPLADVPAHWNIFKMKWIAKMESGHTPDKKVPAYWENGDIPWISLNDTGYLKDNDYISDTAYQITALGIANSSAHLLPPRVVVFSRDATIGRCAITTRPMAVSQHFIAWVCGESMVPEFLLLRLRSMTGELERLTTGATLRTIGMPDVRTLVTPVPPLEEQRTIIEWVATETTKIDELTKEALRAIDLLQERRTALISAAVTGRIDVRPIVERNAA